MVIISKQIKEAVLDILKERVDKNNNNGLAINYKANPASSRILYNNGVVIDNGYVYQCGKPIFYIKANFSSTITNKNGSPKMLTPTLVKV